MVSLISTASDDPKYAKYKEHNWKVVQELKMPGAGNLFVKTHPKSKNLWADAPMNPEREVAESVYVYDLADLSKGAQAAGRRQGLRPAGKQGDPSCHPPRVQRGG